MAQTVSLRGCSWLRRPQPHLLPPSFVLNLGKDNNNLCLHFNPRFDAHGDFNTIVCNSKDGGAWGAEQRETAFPFQLGSVVEVGWGLGTRGRALGGLGQSWVWWPET